MAQKKVGIIDYGIGNLLSIYHAFKYADAKVEFIEANRSTDDFDYLVLPGVGAFGHGMKSLTDSSLQHLIYKFCEAEKPLLGICLGMQMLSSQSDEFQMTEGLDLIPGKVSIITDDEKTRLPFIGWSKLALSNQEDSRLLKGVTEEDYFYFVHSYSVTTDNNQHTKATADYHGHQIGAFIEKDNIFGCQFHPEKSSRSGFKIINNFLQL